MVVRAAFGLGSGITALIAEVTFSSAIGLGSIIVAMLVVVLFGIFTLREKRNNGWKDLYQQEHEKNANLVAELVIERDTRHAIKDDLAATKALLQVEQGKPNLQQILEEQRALWSAAMAPLTQTLKAMQETQEQMLALLSPPPAALERRP